MYAEHRYQPKSPRTVSLGAAFLINGAIIAGMIYSAPNVIKQVTRTFTGTSIPLDPPPPPVDLPKPQPKVESKARLQPPITAPKPTIDTKSQVDIHTTDIIFPTQPDIVKPREVGPPTIVEPKPEPLPPLVSAARDPRYAADFQPQYPASELRAQRDGKVSVRVLVGPDGRVKAVEQLSATSPAFFDATKRQALAKWRFKPASRGGVAQESWMTLTVTFRLEDQ